MRYKGKVYRPPSEAYSLIVQVTYGCSHNGCAFCDMYDDKHFAIRPMEEVREDFEMARRVYKKVERVFLADGDALMRKTEELSQILGLIYGLFPECQRVTCYASPTSLQIKSEDELRLLRSKGQVHSILDDIPGIGPTRRKELMRHFQGIDDIKAATVEELSGLPGMNKKAAEQVYTFFHAPAQEENEDSSK